MPFGFFKRDRELTTVRVRVVLTGQALARPVGLIRQALLRGLAEIGLDIERGLRRVTPRRTGATAAGWQALVEEATDTGQENELAFQLRIENPSSGAPWILRQVFQRTFGPTQQLADFIVDNVQRLRVNIGGLELVGRNEHELVFVLS